MIRKAWKFLARSIRRLCQEIGLRVRNFSNPWLPPRHPFVVWLLVPKHISEDRGKNTPRSMDLWNGEFRLVPDRLALYDLVFALLFFFVEIWLGSPYIAVASLCGLWILFPILFNVFLCRPFVYEGVKATIPKSLTDWFQGLPSQVISLPYPRPAQGGIPLSLRGLFAFKLFMTRISLTRWFRTLERDPVYTQPGSSPQGAFLALAMAEYFDPKGGNVVVSRGFLRFLVIYCAPLWSSYIWLVANLLWFRNEAKPALSVLVFGWAAVSGWFLLRAVVHYGEWLDRLLSDPWLSLRSLPHPPIWRSLAGQPSALMIVRDHWVRVAASLIAAFGVAIALAALQVV